MKQTQFRLSDLLFGVFLAALVGLAYRLQLLPDPTLYLHWRPLIGVAACVLGVALLATERNPWGNVLTVLGAFWTALDSLFMQWRRYGWITHETNEQVAQDGWAAAGCGIVPVGLTLACVVWVAYRRDWSVPWFVLAALTACWLDLMVLAIGNWHLLMQIAQVTRD